MRLIVAIGFLCRMLGFHGHAESQARKAIRGDKSNHQAWRLLGIELADRACGCPPDTALEEEAKNAFMTAYALAPSDFVVVWNACTYLAFLGKFSEALLIAEGYGRIDKAGGAKLLANIHLTEKVGSTRGFKKCDEPYSCDETEPPG